MQNSQGTAIQKFSTGTDLVVMTGKCVLHRIIVGKDVATSVIAVSDSATSGSADIKVRLTGSTLKGVYECRTEFTNGITVTQTNQTDVTYVVSPSN